MIRILLLLAQIQPQATAVVESGCEFCSPWKHIVLQKVLDGGGVTDWRATLLPLNFDQLYTEVKVSRTFKLQTVDGCNFWQVKITGNALAHERGLASAMLLFEERADGYVLHVMAGLRLRNRLVFKDCENKEALTAASYWMTMPVIGQQNVVPEPEVGVDTSSGGTRIYYRLGESINWDQYHISPIAREVSLVWLEGKLITVQERRPSWISLSEIRQFEASQVSSSTHQLLPVGCKIWTKFVNLFLLDSMVKPDAPLWVRSSGLGLGLEIADECPTLLSLLEIGVTGPLFRCAFSTRDGKQVIVAGVFNGTYPVVYFGDLYSALITLGSLRELPAANVEQALCTCLGSLDYPKYLSKYSLSRRGGSTTGSLETYLFSSDNPNSMYGREISLDYVEGMLVTILRRF